jgi:hypothetical protein
MSDSGEVLHIVIDVFPNPESSWVEVLSALLVPLIAVLGLFIAWNQYKINKQRLQHETYERRLHVFKTIKTYLSEVMRDGKTTSIQALKFNSEASEAAFLFDESVEQLISEIYKKSIDMAYTYERMYPEDGSDGLPVGEERSRVASEHSALLRWHADKLVELKPFFAKKLGVNVS